MTDFQLEPIVEFQPLKMSEKVLILLPKLSDIESTSEISCRVSYPSLSEEQEAEEQQGNGY